MKLRTIITQDAEVDDQNSLRHFLLYANEVELQGIVQTSSKFHWRGVPGTTKTVVHYKGEFLAEDAHTAPFDRPYRWTGTDWMFRVLDDYEKDYPNLRRHAEGYPTPDYLRSITKIGNVGYEGEIEAPTEGSELIRSAILDNDPRPLYLQVWGGCNTIVRALMDIEAEYAEKPGWAALHEHLTKKIIITACGEQDETYRTYLAEQWPGILFVKTLQMRSYAYPWFMMPECESKDTLRAAFMKREILNGKSALTSGYCTWMDGNVYEGEIEESQFGSNPNILKEWFGAKMGLPAPEPFDFLSEGDSPTFFLLFDWGFRTLESFAYGGVSGRYAKVPGEYNSKGEELNIRDVEMDSFTGRDGKEQKLESMWCYVADIQRDFAARTAWAAAPEYALGEHAPTLHILNGIDRTARPGEAITITAEAASPDGAEVALSCRIYKDASSACAADAKAEVKGSEITLYLPENAKAGDTVHLLVKAQSAGKYRLVHYAQVIVTIV